MFIVFEGIDGVGKSTQAKLLAQFLEKKQIPHVLTREPGGCDTSENIRKIILDNSVQYLPHTELLLMIAARYEHWHKIMQPALEKNMWVICDRYIDSTRAYQGVLYNIEQSLIDHLHSLLNIPINPDQVFVLSADIAVVLERIKGRKMQNKFDQYNDLTYKKIQDKFLEFAQISSHYCHLNAQLPEDIIHKGVLKKLKLLD